MDISFRAKHVFVRAGELIIGSKEAPYLHNGTITLYGEKDAKAVVYDNAIEAGNKLIANVNKIRMYGKQRSHTLVRLLRPALKGATEILIEKGMDLVPGDRIALLPTSYENTASDDVTVSTYDTATGSATFVTPLAFYHWGRKDTTAYEYNGVDMRGEVIVLSRNIRIQGEDIESWGAQIVTSDTVEFDATTGNLTMREGSTILDSVELFNCSQIDTMKAALRFEGANLGWSSVSNSSLHNGYGWGINVKSSANLVFSNNVIFNFRPIGVSFSGSRNVTFDGNVVAQIQQRTTIEAKDFEDKEGALVTCTYFGTSDKCPDTYVTNNIVAGAFWVGMTLNGHECGKPATSKSYGNVVHSINNSKGGVGAIISPDRSSSTQTTTCFEGSGVASYKNRYQGVMFQGSAGLKVVFSNMTGIDNGLGIGIGMAMSGP